ncbi:MAG: aminotransferase class III-fold pyridoxal phosphate-dependent enzyme, partial [Alphaproteobacteria bacterium]|nr:aminotransferase class III-fold pyridoxal phosphate-dependent enzyme [Alphaproteobacteria bacterium]
MATLLKTNSPLETAYRERTPGSARLYAEAARVLPSGVTHDSRALNPWPVYVARAKGPRKWDVDGNEYVDYYGGHGSLLLGHAHPSMVEAVTRQIELGTHYGSS